MFLNTKKDRNLAFKCEISKHRTTERTIVTMVKAPMQSATICLNHSCVLLVATMLFETNVPCTLLLAGDKVAPMQTWAMLAQAAIAHVVLGAKTLAAWRSSCVSSLLCTTRAGADAGVLNARLAFPTESFSKAT